MHAYKSSVSETRTCALHASEQCEMYVTKLLTSFLYVRGANDNEFREEISQSETDNINIALNSANDLAPILYMFLQLGTEKEGDTSMFDHKTITNLN